MFLSADILHVTFGKCHSDVFHTQKRLAMRTKLCIVGWALFIFF